MFTLCVPYLYPICALCVPKTDLTLLEKTNEYPSKLVPVASTDHPRKFSINKAGEATVEIEVELLEACECSQASPQLVHAPQLSAWVAYEALF